MPVPSSSSSCVENSVTLIMLIVNWGKYNTSPRSYSWITPLSSFHFHFTVSIPAGLFSLPPMVATILLFIYSFELGKCTSIVANVSVCWVVTDYKGYISIKHRIDIWLVHFIIDVEYRCKSHSRASSMFVLTTTSMPPSIVICPQYRRLGIENINNLGR